MIIYKNNDLNEPKYNKLYCKPFVIAGISLFASLTVVNLHALPQGGSVASGQASIQSNNNYMQINQSSNQAVINWQSFNIGAQEHTHFNQPSASSLTINRVNAANGSSAIFGKLTATGQLFLLNPAGVMFGPTAQVNVGSILASTSDLNFEKYKTSGLIELVPNHNFSGNIINHANVKVHDGGYAAFVAPNVQNHGIIRANLGHVQLSSGEYFTVDLYGDDLIHFKIPEDKLNSSINNYEITHTGQIYADGGSIHITSADARDIVSSVIKMDGLVQANTINSNKGNIVLSALNDSFIDFGANSNIYADSGYVKATAKDINLASGSLIDVSSRYSGIDAGEIYIGGNYQGKLLDANDFNAKTVFVAPSATLLANAHEVGDGGKIVVWSDDTTTVAGNFEAKGGAASGNGGLIETSGKINLNILPDINVSTASPNSYGQDGNWLLDPASFSIDTLLANSINAALLNTNVTISTVNTDASPLQVYNEANNPPPADPLNGGNLINARQGVVEFNNNGTPVTVLENDFTVLADSEIIFNTNQAINATASGNVKIVSGLAPENSLNSTHQKIYVTDTVIGNNAPGNFAVNSTGQGLVEFYVRPDILGTPDSNQIGVGTGAVVGLSNDYRDIVQVGPNSQFIQYHWINYNDTITTNLTLPTGLLNNNRTLSNAAIVANGNNLDPVVGFALYHDVDLVPDPDFYGFTDFRGHFDGMGHTIIGMNPGAMAGSNSMHGFFNTTSTQRTTTIEFPYLAQYIKNINFESPIIDNVLNMSTATMKSSGVLIGQADVYSNDNNTSLKVSNININYDADNLLPSGGIGSVHLNLSDGSITNAGGLIGSTNIFQNAFLDVNSINIANLNIDALNNNTTNTTGSSSNAGGLIGLIKADSNTQVSINDTAIIHSDNFQAIRAHVNNPANTDQTTSNAGGLIGRVITGDNTDINIAMVDTDVYQVESFNDNNTNGEANAGGILGKANFGNDTNFNLQDVNINLNIDTLNQTPLIVSELLGINNVDSTSSNAGGVIGHTITDDNSNITLSNLVSNNTSIEANSTGSINPNLANAGGAIGRAQIGSNSTLTASTVNINNGDIKSDNNVTSSSLSNSGGIIGQAVFTSTLTTAANNDLILNDISILESNISAVENSGGLIGQTITVNTSGSGPLPNSKLDITDVTITDTGINSQSKSAGLVAELNNQEVDMSGIIDINGTSSNISALLTSLVSGFSIDNNVYAAGLFAVTDSTNLTLNSTADINTNTNVISETNLENSSAFSGGLIAELRGGQLNFSGPITISGDNLSATAQNITLTGNSSNNNVYAAGLIAHAAPLVNGADSVSFDGVITINSQPVATLNANNIDVSGSAIAGGTFGLVELSNVNFSDSLSAGNNLIINDTPNAVVNANQATNIRAFAGGIFGQDNIETAAFNTDITTHGAVAKVNEGSNLTTTNSSNSGAAAGGISGYSQSDNILFGTGNVVTIDNAIGNSSGDEGEVLAFVNGNNVPAIAGGLFGYSLGSAAGNQITINSDIIVNANVIAETQGAALDIQDVALKYANGGIFAGGVFGLNSGTNSTINGLVNINSLEVTALSENEPLGEAVQASGGLFGGLVNANFTFNSNTFDFINTSITSSNHGFEAGVLGFVDVHELDPTILAGVTNGQITKDAANDGLNWDNSGTHFAFLNSHACQGPSAGLCILPPPPNVNAIVSTVVTETGSDQSTAHGDGSGGHNNAHAAKHQHGGHTEHDPHFYHGHEHQHPLQLLTHNIDSDSWLHDWLYNLEVLEIDSDGNLKHNEQVFTPNTFHYSPSDNKGHHKVLHHSEGH